MRPGGAARLTPKGGVVLLSSHLNMTSPLGEANWDIEDSMQQGPFDFSSKGLVGLKLERSRTSFGRDPRSRHLSLFEYSTQLRSSSGENLLLRYE